MDLMGFGFGMLVLLFLVSPKTLGKLIAEAVVAYRDFYKEINALARAQEERRAEQEKYQDMP